MYDYGGYNGFPDRYLASQPWKLHFAGWETDTYRLQQNGWQLAASQDPRYNCVQIAFKHPEYNIRGISDRVDMYAARARTNLSMYGQDMIEVRAQLASDFVTHTASLGAPMTSFQPIDAEPQIYRMTHRMSEHMVFAPNLARTQELIVPEHSVDDLLNMMLDKQAANRAELIRKRIRQQGDRYDFGERTHVHAQIVSIAG